jgi:hypothetical protein
MIEFADQKHGGREIIFSIKSETFKLYSKTNEIMNNATTTKEKAIAQALLVDRYQVDKVYINEILRVELTLKTPAKILSRFSPHLNGQPPTFQNIFKQSLWEDLLREQMLLVYDHPLKDFVFLASEQKPFIQAFLDQNHKHIETKDTVMGIISSIQEYGLGKSRAICLQKYSSRQTWHNYQQRLIAISKKLDFSTLESLTNYQIYRYILRQFGIDTRQQGQFDLQTTSKKLDTERRNTRERLL